MMGNILISLKDYLKNQVQIKKNGINTLGNIAILLWANLFRCQLKLSKRMDIYTLVIT